MQSDESLSLANEKPFALGQVSVTPASLEISRDGVSQSLEPRIMQVLVVLGRAKGTVVSREELIERCWDGRIVSESAVNRVMSRIRQLGETIGNGSFRLDTINKVGYRLTPEQLEQPGQAFAGMPKPVMGDGRRRFILGASVIAAGLASYGWFRVSSNRDMPPTTARTLYEKGMEAQAQFSPATTRQAIAYYREAVRIYPNYAAAWGAMALSYGNLLESANDNEQESLVAQSASASTRALDLDPDNSDAKVAKIIVRPLFRNWLVAETQVRNALRQHPKHFRLRGLAARLFCDTGRYRQGAVAFEALVKSHPFLPAMQNQLALALWGAGRLEEAERIIEHAIELWPDHRWIRTTHFDFFALTGRPALAMTFLGKADAQPLDSPPTVFTIRELAARALETRSRTDVENMVAALASDRSWGPISAVQFLAALDCVNEAFSLLDIYYMGSKAVSLDRPTLGPRTETDFLFGLPTASLRADPRFPALTRAIGLDDYWRSSRTVPDYRR